MADTVQAITVTLTPSTLTVGGTGAAVAGITMTVSDNQLDNATIVWTSSNPAVATVTGSSTSVVVKAVAAGTAQISAAIGAVKGVAPVTVQAQVVSITQAQETAIKAIPVGQTFVLRGPTTDFTTQVNG